MAQASHDENHVPTLLGVSSSDGVTTIPIQVDSAHTLQVDDNTTGSDLGPTDDKRDQNFVPALMAVSSTDGVTPVIVYADATGKLLINSN